MGKLYDCIIIGSGPAGLTAAIYAARACLSVLVLEKEFVSGGQVVNTYEVDNYPGYRGISGFDLGMKFREHAEKLDVEFVMEAVERVDLEHDTIRFLGKGGRMHEAPLHRDVRPIAEKAMREGRSSLVKLPGNASKQWCQFFDDLGMPDLSFHCTRVTVVTRLARAGFSEGQCMQYVGHASELVHAIYRKLKARDVAQLGDVL